MNVIDEMACGHETWNPKILSSENTTPCFRFPIDVHRGFNCSQGLLQTWAEVSATLKLGYPISQILKYLEYTFTMASAFRSIRNCSCSN